MSLQNTDQKIIDEISAVVRSHLGTWIGGAGLADATPVLRKYPHSFMLRYALRDAQGTPALLVKFVRKEGMKTLSESIAATELRPRAKGEYEILLRTAQLIDTAQDPDCFALRPFAYLDTWNVIVMPEIPSRRLKDFYLHPSIGLGRTDAWNELVKHLKHSARWLRIYHTLPNGAKFEPFPKDKFMGLVEERLQALEKYSRSEVDIASIRKAFQTSVSSADRMPVEINYRHGDFTFSNVLITNEGRACAIDMSKNQMDPIYLDLAYMIIDPYMRMVNALSGGRFASFEQLGRCRQAIIDGYFSEGEYNRSALDLCCAFATLNKWGVDEKKYYYNRAPRWLWRFLIQRVRPYFKKQVFGYLSGASGQDSPG